MLEFQIIDHSPVPVVAPWKIILTSSDGAIIGVFTVTLLFGNLKVITVGRAYC